MRLTNQAAGKPAACQHLAGRIVSYIINLRILAALMVLYLYYSSKSLCLGKHRDFF
jgi:hypothetical protein